MIRMRTRLWALAVAAVVWLGIAPATSLAYVTTGSSLQRAPDVSLQGNTGPFTVLQSFLSQQLAAPSVAPTSVNGSVIRWRIRTGDTDTGPVTFRILRKLSGSGASLRYTGVSSYGPVTPALNTTSTYDVNLPINRGDSIGSTAVSPTSAGTSSIYPFRALQTERSGSGSRPWRTATPAGLPPPRTTASSWRSTPMSSRRQPSRRPS
jgi:hypothetical protein